MSRLSRGVRVFRSETHDCSYLPGRQASTLFVDPGTDMDATLYGELSKLGFRRSGRHIYRPDCGECRQCVPTRIPIKNFSLGRRWRRVLKRNIDVHSELRTDIDSSEFYELYERYINTQHRDGDMYPASEEQYRSFLTREWGVTEYMVYRSGNTLLGVSVQDQLSDGVSAIYTFYEPGSDRSLGNFAILQQIQRCIDLNLSYLYLGYWVRQCQKMQYKTHFRPIQLFQNQHWTEIS